MALQSVDVKIENICRTCLSKEIDLVSVFEVYVGTLTFQNIITTVTGIEITEGEGLPTVICLECRDKATTAYAFKVRTQQSDITLHGLIKQEKQKENVCESQNIVNNEVDVKTEHLCEGTDVYMDIDFNLSFSNSNDHYDDDDTKSINEQKLPLENEESCVNDESKKDHCSKRNCFIGEKDSDTTYCPLCGTSYEDAEGLTKHMWEGHADVMGPKKRGRPKKLLTSMILRKLSENGYPLNIKPEKKYNCAFCKTEFETKDGIETHMGDHKDTIVLRCIICKKIYLSRAHFQQHRCHLTRRLDKLQNGEPPDLGGGKELTVDVMLHEIVVSKTELNNVSTVQVCNACGMLVRSSDELSEHRDNEHPELSLRCHLCEKVFMSVKSAERHRVSCKRVERTFKCTTCGLSFAFEISLNKHILRNHAGQRVSVEFMDRQKAQYNCDTCARTFFRKDLLIRHARAHKTADKYECDVCKKKFNRRSNLKAHIARVHESDRNNKGTNSGLCLYCGRSFNNSSNLIVHMRRHTGEKPYQCDFCGKGFPRSSDLQCHRRSHTGEKPCKCGVCGKGFSRSNKLSRHMRVHTGDKPYKCTYCDKAFSQSNDLTLHVRRHTGDKPYVCEICGERFIQGTALHNHRRTHGHYPETQQEPTLTYTVQNITQTH